MFGAFIGLCALGHLLEIWTLWHPAYWLSGAEQAITALVSCYTAISLFTLLPQFLALKSMNQNLEQLVAERTQELETTNANLKKAQTQLVQSEKMAALGQMVGGIAHEINNPLSFIHGNLAHTEGYTKDIFQALDVYDDYYEKHCADPDGTLAIALEPFELSFLRDDFPRLLKSMKVGANRIQQIVLSLRNFSRLDEVGAKHVDIHEGLDSSLQLLLGRMNASAHPIKLTKSYDSDIPSFECFPGPLNQVFFNLLSNALDAIEDRLTGGVNFSPVLGVETHFCCAQGEGMEGGQSSVEVRFIDNGKAVTPTVKERMFDPFFTTKSIGQGTGLGLYQSREIVVRQHGGDLRFETAPPDRKVFTIKIPIPSASRRPAKSPVAVSERA